MKKLFIFFSLMFFAFPLFADTFTITVSTTVGTRIKTAFGTAYNYQVTIAGSPNPESLAQFTLRMIKQYIKTVTVSQETASVADTARDTQITNSTNEIIVP